MLGGMGAMQVVLKLAPRFLQERQLQSCHPLSLETSFFSGHFG